MAVFSATDYRITINSVDFSSNLAAATLDITREQLEVTSFGNSARRYIAGLQDASVTLSFHQDFAIGSVDSTIFNALGGTVAIAIRPTSSAIGSANPELRFNALVVQTTPFSANVGDLSTMDLTWPVDGTITRAVTA